MTIDPEAFEKWLQNAPEDTVFNEPGNTCRTCPLAKFLGPGWIVNGFAFYLGLPERPHPLPTWARKFVLLFDTSFKQNKATALEALRGSLEGESP